MCASRDAIECVRLEMQVRHLSRNPTQSLTGTDNVVVLGLGVGGGGRQVGIPPQQAATGR